MTQFQVWIRLRRDKKKERKIESGGGGFKQLLFITTMLFNHQSNFHYHFVSIDRVHIIYFDFNWTNDRLTDRNQNVCAYNAYERAKQIEREKERKN